MNTKNYQLSTGKDIILPGKHLLTRGFTAAYAVPKGRMKKYIPVDRLTTARIAPGFSLLIFSYHEFADSPVGSYQQMCIFFPVHLGDYSLPSLPLMTQVFYNTEKMFTHLGFYVWQIPTSSEETCLYSTEIWGEPSWKGDFKTECSSNYIRCNLYKDSQKVFGLHVRRGGFKLNEAKGYRLYSIKNDAVFTDTMRIEGRGTLYFGPGKAGFTMGNHPQYQEFGELTRGMIPVQTMFYDQATIVFNGPKKL